jgi:protein ImuB
MCRLKYERAAGEEAAVSGNGLLAFSLCLFRPSASPRYLCDLLRLRMENVRLAGPVTSIHVEATAVGPLALCQQPLFDAEVEASQPRRLAELVDRLSNRLGRQAVVEVALLPDAQPEYTCVDVPLAGNLSRAASRSKTVNRAKTRARKNLAHVARYGLLAFAADERPIALLPRPAAIEVIAVTPGGAPGQFRWRGRVHASAHVWGPERIETGWWRTEGSERQRASTFVRRDYYRVETKSGARYWIYRNLRTREWFLHGAFD